MFTPFTELPELTGIVSAGVYGLSVLEDILLLLSDSVHANC